MQTYLDLHRHAAVRAALLGHPGIALRLMVAHAIGGSHLWRVSPEPQTTRNDEVRESLETSRAETVFDERRRAVLAVLDFSPEEPTVTGGNGDDYGVAGIFLRLIELPDPVIMEVIRSEEHTSELQSLMRNSYAVFCLTKTTDTNI